MTSSSPPSRSGSVDISDCHFDRNGTQIEVNWNTAESLVVSTPSVIPDIVYRGGFSSSPESVDITESFHISIDASGATETTNATDKTDATDVRSLSWPYTGNFWLTTKEGIPLPEVSNLMSKVRNSLVGEDKTMRNYYREMLGRGYAHLRIQLQSSDDENKDLIPFFEQALRNVQVDYLPTSHHDTEPCTIQPNDQFKTDHTTRHSKNIVILSRSHCRAVERAGQGSALDKLKLIELTCHVYRDIARVVWENLPSTARGTKQIDCMELGTFMGAGVKIVLGTAHVKHHRTLY